jgi:hypothetical protein
MVNSPGASGQPQATLAAATCQCHHTDVNAAGNITGANLAITGGVISVGDTVSAVQAMSQATISLATDHNCQRIAVSSNAALAHWRHVLSANVTRQQSDHSGVH